MYVCIILVSGIRLDKKQQECLSEAILEFESNPTNQMYDSTLHYNEKHFLPKIFIWCPLQHYGIQVMCPVHKTALKFMGWTATNAHEPRLVYDLQGNIILVQAIYSCSDNLTERSTRGHSYFATSLELLNALPDNIREKLPFKMFYRSACTLDLLDYLIVHIGRGHTFLEMSEDIASMNFRAFARKHHGDNLDHYYESIIYSIPSNDQLMFMFLAYLKSNEQHLREK